MKKIFFSCLIVLGLIGLTALVPATSVRAVSPQQLSCEGSGGKWQGNTCENKSSNGPSVQDGIKRVIDLLLFLVGVIAVIVIVISGFRFVTGNGDPQQVKKARDGVIYAVVGIVVAVSAYAIVNFVLDNV